MIDSVGSLIDSVKSGITYFTGIKRKQPAKPASPTVKKQNETGQLEMDPNMGTLIKRMIEVRNLLKIAYSGDSDSNHIVPLPTIVVIGSQSSGKSSVLETIVGKDFLPKGQNMVTKRPLEITLVHTEPSDDDGSNEEYAIFPQLGNGYEQPLYDFERVKETLFRLNQDIPEGAWVCDKPVELFIYSPNVPDLALVDLPGYIAITNKNQPSELRNRIVELCDKYIDPERGNIILAVSASDVDLANSEALRASRQVDPNGQRTIGVMTKVDLVAPSSVLSILDNEDYPLQLGYVGVVCKGQNDSQSTSADEYFAKNSKDFAKYKHNLGIKSLQHKLLQALEREMSASLKHASTKIQSELEDVWYKFKVLYNDRPISMEGYVGYLANALKEALKSISMQFPRCSLQTQIRDALEEELRVILRESFWNINETSTEGSDLLFECTSRLTKCGVGRLTTQLVLHQLVEQLKRVSKSVPFSYHTSLIEPLIEGTVKGTGGLKAKIQHTINQIENSTKPLKFQVDYTPQEWESGRNHAISMLEEEIQIENEKLTKIIKKVGQKNVVKVLENSIKDSLHDKPELLKNPSVMIDNLDKEINEALLLNHRIKMLKERLKRIKTKSICLQPKSIELYNEENSLIYRFSQYLSIAKDKMFRFGGKNSGNSPNEHKSTSDFDAFWEYSREKGLVIQRDPCQFECPEVYLQVVLEKLTTLSHGHVYFEIIQDYLNPTMEEYGMFSDVNYLLPKSSSSSSPTSMTTLTQPGMIFFGSLLGGDRGTLREFVKENPKIKQHLDLQERKEALEQAHEKLLYLLMMKNQEHS